MYAQWLGLNGKSKLAESHPSPATPSPPRQAACQRGGPTRRSSSIIASSATLARACIVRSARLGQARVQRARRSARPSDRRRRLWHRRRLRPGAGTRACRAALASGLPQDLWRSRWPEHQPVAARIQRAPGTGPANWPRRCGAGAPRWRPQAACQAGWAPVQPAGNAACWSTRGRTAARGSARPPESSLDPDIQFAARRTRRLQAWLKLWETTEPSPPDSLGLALDWPGWPLLGLVVTLELHRPPSQFPEDQVMVGVATLFLPLVLWLGSAHAARSRSRRSPFADRRPRSWAGISVCRCSGDPARPRGKGPRQRRALSRPLQMPADRGLPPDPAGHERALRRQTHGF